MPARSQTCELVKKNTVFLLIFVLCKCYYHNADFLYFFLIYFIKNFLTLTNLEKKILQGGQVIARLNKSPNIK